MNDYHVWHFGVLGYITVSAPDITAVAEAFPKANIFNINNLSDRLFRFDPDDGTPVN